MVRIVTYNVHRCEGMDGILSPHRIAEVIASCAPDIVALQEVDVRRHRTGGVDQAELIARELSMELHFHPALRVMEELYGDAILTAQPSRLMKAGPLPGLPGLRHLEPRGALWASIDADGHEVNVVNTHLGLVARERLAQVDALLGPDWLGSDACRGPVVLLGDFNAVPRSRAYRRVARRLGDAQRAIAGRPRPTFPARLPVLRIDHVFVDQSISVTSAETVRTPLSLLASDHLPLVVELQFKARPQPRTPARSA